MAEDAVLAILIKIQERLTAIESRLDRIEATLTELRVELDGQFGLMTSRNSGLEALERIVAGHGQRITALERKF
jgi:hypothetical protein